MRDYLKFYINGAWVDPVTPKTLDVINPATEGVAGRISMGSAADVDAAVRAARAAFASFSQTSVADRVALLDNGVIAEIGTHKELLARSPRYRHVISALDAESTLLDTPSGEGVNS